ncbi:hypothetical protein [Amycolatopsis rubida]|uniref:hypothetical protein n=1 Tax=Amycolatopsis rubida TaxID=112413 RepID=UPI001F1ADD22|nr:hypothetical protein [Amycolatopsis rubida]
MLNVLRHHSPARVEFVLRLLFCGISENRLRHPAPFAWFQRGTTGIVIGVDTRGQLLRQLTAKTNAQPLHSRSLVRIDTRNARRPWKRTGGRRQIWPHGRTIA